jgi:hypothetical protein
MGHNQYLHNAVRLLGNFKSDSDRGKNFPGAKRRFSLPSLCTNSCNKNYTLHMEMFVSEWIIILNRLKRTSCCENRFNLPPMYTNKKLNTWYSAHKCPTIHSICKPCPHMYQIWSLACSIQRRATPIWMIGLRHQNKWLAHESLFVFIKAAAQRRSLGHENPICLLPQAWKFPWTHCLSTTLVNPTWTTLSPVRATQIIILKRTS